MSNPEEWSYFEIRKILPIIPYDTMPTFIKSRSPILCVFCAGEFDDPNISPVAITISSADQKYLLPDGYYKPFGLDVTAAWREVNEANEPAAYTGALAQYVRAKMITAAPSGTIYCRALYRTNVR